MTPWVVYCRRCDRFEPFRHEALQGNTWISPDTCSVCGSALRTSTTFMSEATGREYVDANLAAEVCASIASADEVAASLDTAPPAPLHERYENVNGSDQE